MMKRVVVVGGKGRMGSEVVKALVGERDGVSEDVVVNDECLHFEVIAFGREDDLFNEKKVDLVIDFGSAESSVKSAEFCLRKGVPLIVGSTGQSVEQFKQINKVSTAVPLVIAGNFSIGITSLKKVITETLKTIKNVDDIVLIEKHHRNKKDSPSGTAKELKQVIEENTSAKVQVLAGRGGKEIGTHTIDIYFGEELLSFTHKAFSRKSFADGVKKVVYKIFDLTPGKYSMQDFV